MDTWRDLDEFACGFLVALLFVRQGEETQDEWDGESLTGDIPSDLSFDQVHPDSIRAIAQFCSDWQQKNMDADGDDLGRRLDAANKISPDDFLLEWDGEWVRIASGIPEQYFKS